MALQADPRVERVIGVDTVTPSATLGRAEFVPFDIRTPNVGKIIDAAGVDTVVHVNLVTMSSVARSVTKEINVIGTMQLLAACQRSGTVRKVVVRSSAAVYGSSPRDPIAFTEEDDPVVPPSSGYAKDAVELEGYVRGLARRRPDITVSMLRFANFVGPNVDSPLTRYFRMPMVATVLGYDPRLQFVHEDDGVEVLCRMTAEDHPGCFNVAGDGVMLLSQAVRRTGRPVVRLPARAVLTLGDVGRRFGGLAGFSPELQRWLTYGRVIDTSRAVHELGSRPKYTTEAAFADFLDAHEMSGGGLPLTLFDRLTASLGRPS
jgi:UDP-glucose 4-epimerase